jgi:hypothetical protein
VSGGGPARSLWIFLEAITSERLEKFDFRFIFLLEELVATLSVSSTTLCRSGCLRPSPSKFEAEKLLLSLTWIEVASAVIA